MSCSGLDTGVSGGGGAMGADANPDTNGTIWDLVLTTCWWAPEHFGLGVIKLQPVGRHPTRHIICISVNCLHRLCMRCQMVTSDQLTVAGLQCKVKQNRPQDRSLGHSILHRGWFWTGRCRAHVLCTAAQIRFKPVKTNAAETVWCSESTKQSVMIDNVEGGREIKHHEVARIESQQYISQHFQNGCLRRMMWSIRRPEIWKQIVVLQVTHKLFGNKPLQQLADNWQIRYWPIWLCIGRIDVCFLQNGRNIGCFHARRNDTVC